MKDISRVRQDKLKKIESPCATPFTHSVPIIPLHIKMSSILRTASSSVVPLNDGTLYEVRRGTLKGCRLTERRRWASEAEWLTDIGEPRVERPPSVMTRFAPAFVTCFAPAGTKAALIAITAERDALLAEKNRRRELRALIAAKATELADTEEAMRGVKPSVANRLALVIEEIHAGLMAYKAELESIDA